MALMAAINMVFSLVAMVFPFASLFLIIALPMASVLVVLTCKEKFYPIYAVATIFLRFFNQTEYFFRVDYFRSLFPSVGNLLFNDVGNQRAL